MDGVLRLVKPLRLVLNCFWSVKANSGLWQLAQLSVLLDERIGSQNNILPSRILSKVITLSILAKYKPGFFSVYGVPTKRLSGSLSVGGFTGSGLQPC